MLYRVLAQQRSVMEIKMKTGISILALTVAVGLITAGDGMAEPLAGTDTARPIILNENQTWSYADDLTRAPVTGYDSRGRAVRLFQEVDQTTGEVSQRWEYTGAHRGRIDVSIARAIDKGGDYHRHAGGCMPIFVIRNLSGQRLDRLLVGVDYTADSERIGGFSLMVGPLDDGDFVDTESSMIPGQTCATINAEMTVMECRVTLDEDCRALVDASPHGAVELRQTNPSD